VSLEGRYLLFWDLVIGFCKAVAPNVGFVVLFQRCKEAAIERLSIASSVRVLCFLERVPHKI
jgi:hypothetical protein